MLVYIYYAGLFFICFCINYNNCARKNNVLYIGAIFDSSDPKTETAFYETLTEINEFYGLKHYELQPAVKHVEPNNPHQALMAMCSLLEHKNGIVGVLGPTSKENSEAVQAICDIKEIPQLDIRSNKDKMMGTLITFYPNPKKLAFAYVDLVNAWEWKSFTVLYENQEALDRISELIKMSDNRGYMVVVRQLKEVEVGNYRSALKEIWKSETTNIILDCSINILNDVLIQAQQIGLLTNKYNILITNLDSQIIDMSPFKYGETNITMIRLVHSQTDRDRALNNPYSEYFKKQLNTINIPLETALVKDSVNMFVELLRSYKQITPKTLSCSNDATWSIGQSIVNLMRVSTYKGLTGEIQFDLEGKRSQFKLDVLEVQEKGIENVATWNISEGLNMTRKLVEVFNIDEQSMANKSFIVITCLTEPYGMLKESQTQLYGNDRFEGFAIDLIQELAKMEGFNYTFIIREDKSNGAKDKNGKWGGMIGDLMEYKADLAISDLTITFEREEAVDFTSPFMNMGISILYQKPKKAPPNFFSFADPFAFEVWLLLGAAYFGVSIAFFIMGRLCPDEWNNPYPCVEEPEFLINQFTLRNSFWFTIGSLMQQGSEIAPIAISTRMATGLWWFFTLIMVSSYTANLAAFLTTEIADTQFTDVKELVERADHYGIKYGAKANGATASFFRDSVHIDIYQQIWDYMQKHEKDVMVNDNKIGVEKADKEQYAFFMESTSIEYEIQRHCNLMQVGNLLDDKGYGIAMRKNSPYRSILSTAILKLSESGTIRDLKRKWWEERRGGGLCNANKDNSQAPPLNLKNVGGVFWVTVGGTILACLLVFIEMILYVAKKSVKSKKSFKVALQQELKFYFKFKGLTKPVQNSSENSGKSEKTPRVSIETVEPTKSIDFKVPNYAYIEELRKINSSKR